MWGGDHDDLLVRLVHLLVSWTAQPVERKKVGERSASILRTNRLARPTAGPTITPQASSG
jgi:hypothetical protein